MFLIIELIYITKFKDFYINVIKKSNEKKNENSRNTMSFID